MMRRLANLIRVARGDESRVQFARRLGLSYTFVRAMEHGQRFPSDRVLMEIAQKLDLDSDDFLLAAWCDRSPGLDNVLLRRGVRLPDGAEIEADANGAARNLETGHLNGHRNGH
jgi:transcriptional regulator with XRE-family HTH domain